MDSRYNGRVEGGCLISVRLRRSLNRVSLARKSEVLQGKKQTNKVNGDVPRNNITAGSYARAKTRYDATFT